MEIYEGSLGISKFIPGAFARPCDTCRSTAAVLFCRAHSLFLCTGCDAKVHAPSRARHARVWLCDVCEYAPASVTCRADAAALCDDCDRDVHSANPLSRRHERAPTVPFFGTDEIFAKSVAGDDVITSSWLLPNTTAIKLETDAPEISSSSMDVGLVPDGSSMSDTSYPYIRTTSNTVDLSGSTCTTTSRGLDREARVMRYREKRKNRKFEKTIRYASRKANAEVRPRIKGRFAKQTEPELEPEFNFSAFMSEAAGYDIVPFF